MTLAEAPDVPHDNIKPGVSVKTRSTADFGAEGCDNRKCPARALVRVVLYKERSDTQAILRMSYGDRIGQLFFCGHHFRKHQVEFEIRESLHRAIITDRRAA